MIAPLLANPLPTVADEVAAALPALLKQRPTGPVAADIAAHIGVDYQSARKAMEALELDKRAKIVRCGRALHLVAANYSGRLCVICRREFTATRKDTRTCSRSCGRHLAYQNEDMRRRHRQSVRASRTPELRQQQSEYQSVRCADPAVRQQMSENNRTSWRDPVKRANRIIAIADAWRGDKAEGRREKARGKKLSLWSDPEWKTRTCEAMRNGTRARFKRAVLNILRQNSEIEAKAIARQVGLSEEQVKIIWRRAFRMGEIDRKPADGRKDTHCIHGHEFTHESTYINKLGHRSCKTCAKLRHKLRKRATANLRSRVAGENAASNAAASGSARVLDSAPKARADSPTLERMS